MAASVAVHDVSGSLEEAQFSSKQDLYVILNFGSEEWKSHTKNKTRHAAWINEMFEFRGGLGPTSLEVTLMDKDRVRVCWWRLAVWTSDDLLGKGTLDLRTLPEGEETEVWVDLAPKGRVKLRVSAKGTGSSASAPAPTGGAAVGGPPASRYPQPSAPPAATSTAQPSGYPGGPPITSGTLPGGPVGFVPTNPYDVPTGADFYEVMAPHAKPVVMEPAYPNQNLPPGYLLGPPPTYQPPAGGQYGGPPTFYGPPPGYQAPPYAPPPYTVVTPETSPDPTVVLPPPLYFSTPPPPPDYQPQPEVTLDCSDGDYISTAVDCDDCDPAQVSHINLWNNDVERIEGLDRFPNLQRLTLKTNDLKSLAGIDTAVNLRYLDVSNNDLTSFHGMGVTSTIEWLDVNTNDLKDFSGFAWAENITWVNAFNNDLSSLRGINAMRGLKVLDVHNNDLTSIRGLDECRMLQEVNLKSNDLEDMDDIKALADLPFISRIDIRDNNYSRAQREQIRDYFAARKPDCDVVMRL